MQRRGIVDPIPHISDDMADALVGTDNPFLLAGFDFREDVGSTHDVPQGFVAPPRTFGVTLGFRY